MKFRLTILSIVSLLLGLALSSNQVFAQCDANAGSSLSGKSFYCSDGEVSLTAISDNTGLGFSTVYLATNPATSEIVATSADGKFPEGTFAPGAYNMLAMNYENANAPIFSTGNTLSDINAQSNACFQMGNAKTITIFTPVVMTWQTFCMPNVGGGYFLEVTIDGGFPEYANFGTYEINIAPSAINYNSELGFARDTIGPFPNGACFPLDTDNDGWNCSVGQVIVCGPECEAVCDPTPGVMDDDVVYVCDGDIASVSAAGQQIDTDFDETFTYWITDAVGSFTVYGNGDFALADIPNGQYNTEYYIYTSVGPDNNNDGVPDEGDACTAMAGPTPVVYLMPIIVALEEEICNESEGTFHVLLSFVGGMPEYDGSAYNVIDAANAPLGETGPTMFIGPLASGASWYVDVNDNTGCPTANLGGTLECKKGPMPIELLDFSGQVLDNGNLITWTTASEIDNDYFTIYYSNDGGNNFEPVYTTNGAGNSSEELSYQFLHQSPESGLTYYKLEQTDFNGATAEFQVITLMRGDVAFEITQVAPTPAKDVVGISFNNNSETTAQMSIYDITGKLVQSQDVQTRKGLNTVQLNVNNFIPGVYFVRLNNNSETITTKFVKER